MAHDGTAVKFSEVFFEYGPERTILEAVSFTVRRGLKVALMGQNGVGKSTLFDLILGTLKPESGKISIPDGLSIAVGRQVIPRAQADLSVREFFEQCFAEKIYNIDPKIEAVLEIVHLKAPFERIVKTFSGGQQARLLLASALIQDPDLLLLDEPTNNLDRAGIEHLTEFIKMYKKTVIVISHDAAFLNAFTDGVLYLDNHTKKIEQYRGNYFDVVKEISVRIERENMKNARLAKQIQAKKDQANVFANKGGGMRLVAKHMRERAETLSKEKVEVRREDKVIRAFTIPNQPELQGKIIQINTFTVIRNHKPVGRKVDLSLKKGGRLLLKGPNGIGKSTLLEAIAHGRDGRQAEIKADTRVGYYRQDFSTLNFQDTVRHSLYAASELKDEHLIRSVAAGFLITSEMINNKIGNLSEGQKGLVAFARLVLQRPGLLILDEPTNHINFRHIPVIAEALNQYAGALILVSHVPDFVAKIRIDIELDLEQHTKK